MKNKLRKKHTSMRKKFDLRKKKEADGKIFSKLKKLPAFKQAEKVMVYISTEGEPDTRKFIDEIINSGKKVYAPRIENGQILPAQLKHRDELKPGKYSIPQPPEKEIVPLDELDIVLVPGVCFSSNGDRLGRGGGYYDRFLSKLPPKTKTVGLCYSFQLEERVPRFRHDFPVAEVITEK